MSPSRNQEANKTAGTVTSPQSPQLSGESVHGWSKEEMDAAVPIPMPSSPPVPLKPIKHMGPQPRNSPGGSPDES